MDRKIDLKLATKSDVDVLKHLWDLYSYDFSIYDNADIEADGHYDFYYGDNYFDNEDRRVFFIMVNDKYAGFASVSNNCYILNKPKDKCIVDFFVMNKYRKGGIGKHAAYKLFEMFPTRWEVAQYNNNEVSKVFWEKIISAYTNSRYEIRRVLTKSTTQQALIFDSIHKKNSKHEMELLKTLDKLHHIRLYSKASDDLKNKLVYCNERNYPSSDEFYKNLRKDLDYQAVITMENVTDVENFIIHTSIGGILTITYSCFENYNIELASHILQALKVSALQNGYDKILVSFDSTHTPNELIACYEKNNFYKVAVDAPLTYAFTIDLPINYKK